MYKEGVLIKLRSVQALLDSISLVDGPYADYEQDRVDAYDDVTDIIEAIEEVEE